MVLDLVPVSPRALTQRIDRALRPERLKAARGRQREELGNYYVVDQTSVIQKHVDLEVLARTLELLRPWETLAAKNKENLVATSGVGQ